MKKEITNKRNSKNSKVGKELLLSLQHMFAMFGATVTVPILTGMDVSLALISAGIGTILFYFITKRKVPVFLGSSFAFLPGIMAAGYESPGQQLSVMIALVCAALIYMIFALIIKLVGVEKIKKLFPPIVVGPVIIVIGLTLAGTIILNNIWIPARGGDVFRTAKIPGKQWRYWTTAIITAVTIVVTNAYAKPKSFMKVIPILLGFGVGYAYAMAVGIVNFNYGEEGFIFAKTAGDIKKGTPPSIVVFQGIFTSPEKSILGFYKTGWKQLGGGTLATAMLSIIPIAVVTFMEHIGDISANSVVCKKDFMVDPGLHRTVLGDGVATMVSAFLGGPANTTYGENTAVLAITKNYNPKNIFYAALMAIGLGIFTPFAEFIKGIPGPVVGGASVVLFGMIAANGLRALVDAKVNFSSTKNMLVVSITLALGLGLGALSLFRGDQLTCGKAYKVGFPIQGGSGFVEISPLAIATLVAIILNLIIPSKRGKTQEEIESKDKPIYTLAGKVIDEEKSIEDSEVVGESEVKEDGPKVETVETTEEKVVEQTETVEEVDKSEDLKEEKKSDKKVAKKKLSNEGEKDEEVR